MPFVLGIISNDRSSLFVGVKMVKMKQKSKRKINKLGEMIKGRVSMIIVVLNAH